MKKIIIISTGGTIVSADDGKGAAPDAERAKCVLSAAADYIRSAGFECEVDSIFGEAGLDSSDISPREWLALSRAVSRHAERGAEKFLVVHGTDTLAYSAAWLSLTTRGVCVTLTGSQRTPDEAGFDGAANLLGAAKLLFEKNDGVWVYFAGEIFHGAYVHKSDSCALSAYVATGSGESLSVGLPGRIPEGVDPVGEIAVVYIHPACSGNFPESAKILILCGYGAGNMPRRLHSALEARYRAARPVIIAASSCERGAKDPSRYAGVGMSLAARRNFTVFSQGNYSVEFLITLSYLALLHEHDAPEKILGRCLEKL